MAITLVDLYNQALSKCGTRSRLVTTTDNRREAELCNLWYPTVRDTILKAYPWPVAKAYASPTFFAQQDSTVPWNNTMPPPEWQYAYSMPTDYLYPRHIATWEPFDTGQIGDALMLFTNAYNPVLCYTKKLITQLDEDVQLYMAMVLGLAAYIVEPLTGRGATAMSLLKDANGIVLDARLAAANEHQVEYEHIPDFLAVRGFSSIQSPNRFYFANGPLLLGNTL